MKLLGSTKEGRRSFSLGEELVAFELGGCDSEGDGDAPVYSSRIESNDMLDLLTLDVAARLESVVC